MEIRSIKWTGKKGNEIELKASCETTTVDNIADSDGYKIDLGKKPYTRANLELWIDGKKIDSCWDTNFWRLIDAPNCVGYQKIWGLNIMMVDDQAIKVDAFLKAVIKDGKNADAISFEAAEANKEAAEQIAKAERIMAQSEHTITNSDGTLMTDDQAKSWAKRYNDINNEGGDGYIPQVVTAGDVEWAKRILG